jgi:hypothetical protein
VTKAKTPSFIVSPYETMSVDELGDVLKRQILELAIDSDNPQFKLDAFKATVERSTKAKQVEGQQPEISAMTAFQNRVRDASDGAK